MGNSLTHVVDRLYPIPNSEERLAELHCMLLDPKVSAQDGDGPYSDLRLAML